MSGSGEAEFGVSLCVMDCAHPYLCPARRFKIPEWKWEEAKKRFPSLPKVNQKRLRRMEYVLATGKFPLDGWTPPHPKNRSTLVSGG
jgi:hypothetical protein